MIAMMDMVISGFILLNPMFLLFFYSEAKISSQIGANGGGNYLLKKNQIERSVQSGFIGFFLQFGLNILEFFYVGTQELPCILFLGAAE